jgi:hypothetical protein
MVERCQGRKVEDLVKKETIFDGFTIYDRKRLYAPSVSTRQPPSLAHMLLSTK